MVTSLYCTDVVHSSWMDHIVILYATLLLHLLTIVYQFS